MYERHASFAGGLLARKTSQGGSYVRPGNFVFGMGQHREPRTKAFKEIPDMRKLPAMRYSNSGGTAPAMNGGNSTLGGLSFALAGGTHNDPAAGSSGLSVQASTPSRVLAPKDQADSELAKVAATSRATGGPVAGERTEQRHIARKAALSGYARTANVSAGNAPVGDAFYGRKAKGYQERERTQMPLPAPTDAAEPEMARSHALPDGVSSGFLAQRSISFAYGHPVDQESRPRLPLTARSGTSGIIARQLQNNGSGGMAGRPLESYRLPSSRPASMGLMPGIAPSGGTPTGQITVHHGDGRVRHDEYVPHRLPVSSPMIATQRDTSSTQSSLRLAPMHLTGTSRLSGPTLQPLNSHLPRSPGKQPVGGGLPITRSVALQRLSKPGAPDTPSNLPDAAGVHMPLPQAHQHDDVPILRKTITQSAGSIMMSRDAAATGETGIVPHMDPLADPLATHPEPDPASHIPLQRAARIPQAQPLVQRLSGSESPWGRWEPSSPEAARHRNMPSSTRELFRPAPLHLTEAIRPSRMVSQSPPEPITSGIYASLYQANRHDLRQHGNRPLLRKTIAPSTGNIGINDFSATQDVADAMPRLDHSIARADQFSYFAELPPAPHGLGYSDANLRHKPAAAGNAQASGVLSAATAAFSATPSATPAIRRLAAGITGTRPVAQRHLQGNSHSIASIPERSPDARRKWATTRSTSHEGTGSSHAGVTLAADIEIAENHHGDGHYQEMRGAHSGWTPGTAGRPLVMTRRTSGQLMRATDDKASAPAYSLSSTTPEDRYGVVPAPHEGLREAHGASDRETPGIAAPSREPDPEEMAEQAWRIMVERLVIEQERRGLAKWP